MTVCNMTIEGGGRAGHDRARRHHVRVARGPRGGAGRPRRRRRAVARGCGPTTAPAFDREIVVDAGRLSPLVTWGTTPAQVVGVGDRVPSRSREPTSARCATWRSSPVRRCRTCGWTASSSAPARTPASATCAPPRSGRRPAPWRRRSRDGRPRIRAGARAGRGGGPGPRVHRRRVRLAHRRLLDVPGRKSGTSSARGGRCAWARTATSRAARGAAGAPPSSHREMAAAAAVEGHFVDIRSWS